MIRPVQEHVGKLDIASTAIVLFAAGAIYAPFLATLIAAWDTNDDYSHGYFIPFLSLYLVYAKRNELRQLAVLPSNVGLVVLSLGLAQLVIAKIGSEFFLQRTSVIVVLLGLVLFFLGWQFFKSLFLPIAYLIFMIPLPAIIWNTIAFPMQLFASALTENVVSWLGIPIYREGNVLHLAQTTLEVVEACSGLRSLLTMFALSSAMALLSSLSTTKKIILFLSAVPIAIFANICRLTFTAILASRMGSEAAQGFLHEFSGMVVFLLGMGLLFATSAVLSKTRV